jgi:hypothetical protein
LESLKCPMSREDLEKKLLSAKRFLDVFVSDASTLTGDTTVSLSRPEK